MGCISQLFMMFVWQRVSVVFVFFFFQAEDGIRDVAVTGVQTCALPILRRMVAALLKDGRHEARLNAPVLGLRRAAHGALLQTANGTEPFDAVVLACHSEIGRASCRERV